MIIKNDEIRMQWPRDGILVSLHIVAGSLEFNEVSGLKIILNKNNLDKI